MRRADRCPPAHHQSPPVEADFGPSHDAITAELLDLTCQFLTHASPTVRAELGQFRGGHGQHPVAGLGAFLDCLQLSAARHHRRDHTATVSRCRTTWLRFPPTLAHVAVMIRTMRTPSRRLPDEHQAQQSAAGAHRAAGRPAHALLTYDDQAGPRCGQQCAERWGLRKLLEAG
jgi:hypothetical protein